MRFQVPQFINVEDRLFGPFTVKQFVYLAGGGGACFLIWRLVGWFPGIFLMVPIVAFALALAFGKVNGMPFIFVLEAAFKYAARGRLYLWHKRDAKPVQRKKEMAEEPALSVPKLSESRLKELTWSLDVHEITSPGSAETMAKRER